jgi:hypothetical protein
MFADVELQGRALGSLVAVASLFVFVLPPQLCNTSAGALRLAAMSASSLVTCDFEHIAAGR